MAAPVRKRIVILGATGSIGTSSLDVLRAHPEQFELVGLTGHSRWERLVPVCREFRPRFLGLTGCRPQDVPANAFPSDCEIWFGSERLRDPDLYRDCDLVISAIVGAAGLLGTWAAVEAGKTVGLANKESMVVAGPLMNRLAEERDARIIPVDSEHSAIFQALQCGRRADVRRLILTASGGPFRTAGPEELASVTAETALRHPTWNMGPKITIDSATMMNKALEVIEARWLFDVEPEQIDVVVHPQSIVHSLVEYIDGSVLAQMSPPDMRLPIQYALTWPDRIAGTTSRCDFSRPMTLTFEPPDPERFPALDLGFEVAGSGGTSGAVLNAANEIAVQRFLGGELQFLDIPRLCRSILQAHDHIGAPTLEELLAQDQWARQEASRWNSQTLRSPSLTPQSC